MALLVHYHIARKISLNFMMVIANRTLNLVPSATSQTQNQPSCLPIRLWPCFTLDLDIALLEGDSNAHSSP